MYVHRRIDSNRITFREIIRTKKLCTKCILLAASDLPYSALTSHNFTSSSPPSLALASSDFLNISSYRSYKRRPRIPIPIPVSQSREAVESWLGPCPRRISDESKELRKQQTGKVTKGATREGRREAGREATREATREEH
jgi:hypothetical protein